MWLVGYMNISHEMDSNLNISPKMSCDVLECDIVMLQNYMLMILIKEFVINKWCYLYQTLCIYINFYVIYVTTFFFQK